VMRLVAQLNNPLWSKIIQEQKEKEE